MEVLRLKMTKIASREGVLETSEAAFSDTEQQGTVVDDSSEVFLFCVTNSQCNTFCWSVFLSHQNTSIVDDVGRCCSVSTL